MLGHHIIYKFQWILEDVDTSCETLLPAITKLLEQLLEIDSGQMITTDHVFNFVPAEIFDDIADIRCDASPIQLQLRV